MSNAYTALDSYNFKISLQFLVLKASSSNGDTSVNKVKALAGIVFSFAQLEQQHCALPRC